MSLLDELGLADVERVVFTRPPLMLVVCQVRFTPVLSVTVPQFVAPFQRAIKDEFPILTHVTQVQVEMEVSAEHSVEGRSLSPTWRFADRSGTWTAVLAPDSFALETRQYTHFDEFIERLQRVLAALKEHIQPEGGSRLGLRYINEIRAETGSPAKALRSELVGLLSAPEFGDHATLAIQEVQLQFSDAQSIHVRHGLLPEGSTVEPRSGQPPPAGPFYLLDFDAFRTFSELKLLPMNPETIYLHVTEYHSAIERLFRWAVTDEYTRSLGVRNDN
jgi:uncharacterized protein (TIGR04255 family)